MGFEDKNYFSLKSTGPLLSSIQHWWWEVISQFDSHFFIGEFEVILWDFLEYSICLNGMTKFVSFFINWAVHCGSFQSDDIDSPIVLGNSLQQMFFDHFLFSLLLCTYIGHRLHLNDNYWIPSFCQALWHFRSQWELWMPEQCLPWKLASIPEFLYRIRIKKTHVLFSVEPRRNMLKRTGFLYKFSIAAYLLLIHFYCYSLLIFYLTTFSCLKIFLVKTGRMFSF